MGFGHSPHLMVPIVLQYNDCVKSMQDKQAEQGTRRQGQGAHKQRVWDVLAQRIITQCSCRHCRVHGGSQPELGPLWRSLRPAHQWQRGKTNKTEQGMRKQRYGMHK